MVYTRETYIHAHQVATIDSIWYTNCYYSNTKDHMEVRNAFKSTLFLKATSLIIGFLFWTLMSDSFTTYRWITVPVCFYNRGSEIIEAPETIKVELRGRRSHLRHLQVHTLALHIDAKTLKPGTTAIQLTPDHLSLPSSIAFGDIIPHNFSIKCSSEVHT